MLLLLAKICEPHSKNVFGTAFDGPIILFGTLLEDIPLLPQTTSHGPSSWEKDAERDMSRLCSTSRVKVVTDCKDLQEMEAAEVYVKRSVCD